MTTKEVIELLSQEINDDGYSVSVVEYLDEDGECEVNGVKIKWIETHGVYEGAGEAWWLIFTTEKDGLIQTWKWPGSYISHEGLYRETSSVHEVEGVKTTVTVWQKKKPQS